MAVNTIALSFSIALGGYAFEYSKSTPFFLTALTSFIALICVFFINESGTEKHTNRTHENTPNQSVFIIIEECLQHLKQLASNGSLTFSIAFALLFCATTPFTIYSQSLFNYFDFSPSQIGWSIGIAELSGAICSALAWYILSKESAYKNLTAMCALSSIFLLLTAIDNSLIALLTLLSVNMIPAVAWILFNDEMHSRIPSKIRASTMSMLTSLISIFIGVSYVLFGFLVDEFGVLYGLSATGLIPLLGILVLKSTKSRSVSYDRKA